MSSHKYTLFALALLLSIQSCSLFQPETGRTESMTFFSAAIAAPSTVIVYYPDSYSPSTSVIYLLNGWGTRPSAWGTGMDLAQQAHNRDIIFVSLSAGNHTYSNDLTQPNEDYEDYVLEIVSAVEAQFEIEIDSTQRALCGISNGGGGALFLLSEHPELFAAAGSLSGTHYSALKKYDNFNDGTIRIDIGIDDNIISQVRWFHNKLNEFGISHDYREHAGNHNWTFWKKWAPKQFDFLEAIISG